MAAAGTVELTLHIVRSEAGVRGTVELVSGETYDFEGWLALTASIARAIDHEHRMALTEERGAR
jgi:hypothetical protein